MMTKIKWSVVAFLLLAGGRVTAQYRTFRGADGRQIQAKIIKVDARSGKVTVERENRRKITVPVSLFCGADQAYIQEWQSAQDFLSNSRLRVTLTKQKEKRPKGPASKKPKAPCCYQILLNNRSDTALSNLYMKYRLYVNKKSASVKLDDKLSIISDSTETIQLPAKSRHSWETKVIELYTYAESVTDYYTDSYGYEQSETSYDKTAEDHLEGICVRLFMKTPSGNEFMREIFAPDTMAGKYSWDMQGQ